MGNSKKRRGRGRPISSLPSHNYNKNLGFNQNKRNVNFGEQLYQDFIKYYDIKDPKDLIEIRQWVENQVLLSFGMGFSEKSTYYFERKWKDSNGKERTILFDYDLNRIKNKEIFVGDINELEIDNTLDSRIYNEIDELLDDEYFNKKLTLI